ncbi:calcineurin B-like protein 10 isoform X2 [Jatropha curcas]|uniref:calcineurin B-like protein 10 isoform X2 n=1 Tax=Jatropha curcas TaxID=180498 RepID=UPI0009D669D8|nr:calcineurin B-like protein 10 isoform X2 [Jatropha curcas]
MDSTGSSLQGSSYLTIHARLCSVFKAIGEAVISSFVGCFIFYTSTPKLHCYTFNDLNHIASRTLFTVNEVEALLELFKKLSSSIIDDGFIHKEELQLALLRTTAGKNIFLDRKEGVIDFEEFVYAFNVFHPRACLEDKIDFLCSFGFNAVSFRLYDLRQTGYIEKEEVRQMLNATMLESGLQLSEEHLEAIIEKTFADADVDKDGKINKEEWKAFVILHPTLLKHMTLPYLKDITTVFPSFIFNTEVAD